jgi:hypothetical protein
MAHMLARKVCGLAVLMVALSSPAALEAQSQLRGRLIDAKGDPIPGAVITVTDVGFQVRTDSSGRFAIAGQRGSTLKLQFSAPGFRNDTASIVLGRSPTARDFTLLADDVPMPDANPSATMLRGRVTDDAGTPLSYANIQVNFGRRYLSDDSGRFQIPWTTNSTTLLVRRIGFEPAELRLTALPDTSVRIAMTPIAVQLKGVVVTGASPFRSLDTYGFYGRMKDAERGINHGYFITPEDIERRKPNWITQMMEGFPTVRVCGKISKTCPAGDPRGEFILGSNACLMTVYLDNIRIVGGLNGQVSAVNELALPTSVAAVEVYPRAVNAPPQYQPLNGNCGVVLIWTK